MRASGGGKQEARIYYVKKDASFLNERLFVFRDGFQQKAMDSPYRGKLK